MTFSVQPWVKMYSAQQSIHPGTINFCSYIELEVKCITGTDHSFQVFDCKSNNQLKMVLCSFDRKTPERCSFPLEVNIKRFGTKKHTLHVLFVDVFRQGKIVSFEFQLAERKCIKNYIDKCLIILHHYNLHSFSWLNILSMTIATTDRPLLLPID